jgi:hypothetical protein
VVKVAAEVAVDAEAIAANRLNPGTTANHRILPAWMSFASPEMGH